MAEPRKLIPFRHPLTVAGVTLDVAGAYRDGSGIPLVFLHGFGGTKEDYSDVIQQAALADRPVLAYDAPGCGATICDDLSAISIPFLVTVAEQVLAIKGIDRFHLVGHSMGGLTALMLADGQPDRVAGFVDIEGNIAPEDCFLSRQIVTHSHHDPQDFLDDFIQRVWTSRFYGSSLYASGVAHKVRAGAVRPIFESMVDLSDNGKLTDRFLSLPFPRMYMYGVQNNTLSYLPLLADHGVELAEIPACGHFPMYSNAPEMWSRISTFVNHADLAPAAGR